MTKFGDIYINHFPDNEQEGCDTFNIVFLKIGEIVKVGIAPASTSAHHQIVEQLLRSENIFSFHKQIGKTGKEIPKAEFYDEKSKKHGKIIACGYVNVDFGRKHIKFFGNSPEYAIGMKLIYARNFMENYYSHSGYTYEVE